MMTDIEVINGDLYVIFNKNESDVLVSYRLSNGAEIDFFEDTLVQLILPNFEAQLGRGPLADVPIEYVSAQLINCEITLVIKILNDEMNIKIGAESLRHKL